MPSRLVVRSRDVRDEVIRRAVCWEKNGAARPIPQLRLPKGIFVRMTVGGGETGGDVVVAVVTRSAEPRS